MRLKADIDLPLALHEVGSANADKLVAHRGFHCVSDSLHRPLENTLAAYEYAWGAGVRHCECDIALTSDGRLILCHDNSIERLALKPEKSKTPVRQLAFEDLKYLPLKNGSRVPLVEEVLEAAVRAGEDRFLVVELKPDVNATEVSKALCDLLCECPSLISKISVVMSFDPTLIHEFNRLYKSTVVEQCQHEAHPSILLLMKSVFIEDTSDDSGASGADTPPFTGTNAKGEVVLNLSALSDSITRARSCLIREGQSLDGLYMQFNESMLDRDSGGAEFIRLMAKEVVVGVWGKRNDPDTCKTFVQLCDLGAHYVNSDLPGDFLV